MNHFAKLIGAVACSWGLTFAATTAQAAPILSFNNAQGNFSQTYNVGDTILLDVWLSGLTDADMGGFDLNLTFDNAVSTFSSATFSSALDDSLFADLQILRPNADALSLAGVSLAFDLSGQADNLQLFSLVFTAGSAGTSVLGFDFSLFSDAFGSELLTENYIATLTVEAPAAVDEPGTFLLLGLGLAMIASRRIRPAK